MIHAILAAMLIGTPVWAETAFHFYGAEDCPPCMAFKRNHLADVKAAGAAQGFAVHENVIALTADVPTVGSYGASDPILREALKQGALIPYPPVFFISEDGNVRSVHGHDWRAALAQILGD